MGTPSVCTLLEGRIINTMAKDPKQYDCFVVTVQLLFIWATYFRITARLLMDCTEWMEIGWFFPVLLSICGLKEIQSRTGVALPSRISGYLLAVPEQIHISCSRLFRLSGRAFKFWHSLVRLFSAWHLSVLAYCWRCATLVQDIACEGFFHDRKCVPFGNCNLFFASRKKAQKLRWTTTYCPPEFFAGNHWSCRHSLEILRYGWCCVVVWCGLVVSFSGYRINNSYLTTMIC